MRNKPGCQMMGEHEYNIWSMSYDWEPLDDPNGHPINFEKVNHFGSFASYDEAKAALAKMTVWDEHWGNVPEPGCLCIYWIWLETPMMEVRLEFDGSDPPPHARAKFTKLLTREKRHVE